DLDGRASRRHIRLSLRPPAREAVEKLRCAPRRLNRDSCSASLLALSQPWLCFEVGTTVLLTRVDTSAAALNVEERVESARKGRRSEHVGAVARMARLAVARVRSRSLGRTKMLQSKRFERTRANGCERRAHLPCRRSWVRVDVKGVSSSMRVSSR